MEGRKTGMEEDFDFRPDTTTWGHSRQMGGHDLSSQTPAFFSWHLAYFTRLKIPEGVSDLEKKGLQLLTMLSGALYDRLLVGALSLVRSPIINWHF